MRSKTSLDRRGFVKGACATGVLVASSMLAAGCAQGSQSQPEAQGAYREQATLPDLPLASPDTKDQFGIDRTINMHTIDEWLDRDDVVYIDARLFVDPADFAALGGSSDLEKLLTGFKVVPYPYVGTLAPMPLEGGYAKETLFDVTWNNEGGIDLVVPNYRESEDVLKDLFPRDKAIFIMCGAGGYANMLRQLLVHLGWDESRLYNIGGEWSYEGENYERLVVSSDDFGTGTTYAPWRANYALIDFSLLHPR